VIGEGREGLLDNAAQAKLTFDGNWFNLDEDIETGKECNETRLYDPLNDIEWEWTCPADSLRPPLLVPKGEVVWVNGDCDIEVEANEQCPNSTPWCTGPAVRRLRSTGSMGRRRRRQTCGSGRPKARTCYSGIISASPCPT